MIETINLQITSLPAPVPAGFVAFADKYMNEYPADNCQHKFESVCVECGHIDKHRNLDREIMSESNKDGTAARDAANLLPVRFDDGTIFSCYNEPLMDVRIQRFEEHLGYTPERWDIDALAEMMVERINSGYQAGQASRAAWVAVSEPQKPKHKVTVWITYEPATGLRCVDRAWYNMRRRLWLWPWSNEIEVVGDVLAWMPCNDPAPYQNGGIANGE